LPEKRVYAALSSERRVRGELSRVYLRIMRELAVRAGVAFDPVPATQAFALPEELLPIAAKLQAYALGEDFAGLSEEEIALLCRRYIHLSAHWNAAKGKHNSALAVMFINRPAEGGKRKEYPNA
ncbi:TPA: type IV secretion protein Rhs, partial [Pseudomonas aeruginosa]|nr:type IV secretion protein Rhs [Pseudomonas aeruginosa]